MTLVWGYDTIKENEKVEVIVENSKLKDRLFDKVYESDESKMHLAEFLIGKAPREIDSSNVRPVIFGNKYNDLAFLYDGCMYIMLEEQSTECVNIAYRLLEYVVAGLRQQIDSEQILYGTKRIMFPVPKLFTVNVGIDNRKKSFPIAETEIKLSDSYMQLQGELAGVNADLEVTVHKYDFRMKGYEVLDYINENVLPQRLQSFNLVENELLQYAVSAASITYIQMAKRQADSKDNIIYQLPEKIRSIAEMIALLIERNVLKALFVRKEVCDMTIATFSREDILRVSFREEGREEGRILEKRDMAINLYKQGVSENIIAQAAGVEVEVLKNWISEAIDI